MPESLRDPASPDSPLDPVTPLDEFDPVAPLDETVVPVDPLDEPLASRSGAPVLVDGVAPIGVPPAALPALAASAPSLSLAGEKGMDGAVPHAKPSDAKIAQEMFRR